MSEIRSQPCQACGTTPLYARGWCVRCYKRWHRTGSPDPSERTKPGEPMRFFLAHLDDETDDCVIWPYGKDEDGYGVVPVNGRAHVLACVAAHGPRPPGREVGHTCDEPACFNQRHVRWVTRQENEDEKTARGRRPPAWNIVEFTPEQVADIMAGGSVNGLARRYGVSRGVIDRVRRMRP